jgi:hypothetical protein
MGVYLRRDEIGHNVRFELTDAYRLLSQPVEASKNMRYSAPGRIVTMRVVSPEGAESRCVKTTTPRDFSRGAAFCLVGGKAKKNRQPKRYGDFSNTNSVPVPIADPSTTSADTHTVRVGCWNVVQAVMLTPRSGRGIACV